MFSDAFKQPPQWRVVAPGRVCIIGEHVDHQLYDVLACAIDQSIQIESASATSDSLSPHTAASVADQTCDTETSYLDIRHADPSLAFQYPPRECATLNDVQVRPEDGPQWSNYVLAAYIGIMEYAATGDLSVVGKNAERRVTQEQIDQITAKYPNAVIKHQLLVNGSIPAAAGLSSSSALVVAAAKAFCLGADGVEWLQLSKRTLAAISAECERYTGMAGGGMDQASICLCTSGFAQRISFAPLDAVSIPLPRELAIVVANCGRESPKVKNAAKMYNKRVFELKAGCLLMLSHVDRNAAQLMAPEKVLDLNIRTVVRDVLKLSEAEVLQSLATYVEQKPYTRDDLRQIMSDEQRQFLLDRRCGQTVWDQNEVFFIYERIRHVLTEVLRVNKFVGLCLNSVHPHEPTPEATLVELGQLVHATGESLMGDFDNGCEALHELCDLAEANGSLGTRPTGAGWGGCTISLVPIHKVSKFMAVLREKYFEPLITGKRSHDLELLPKSMDQLDQCLFSTTPSDGLSFESLLK